MRIKNGLCLDLNPVLETIGSEDIFGICRVVVVDIVVVVVDFDLLFRRRGERRACLMSQRWGWWQEAVPS